MKTCAYCGNKTKLTKEHIWPASLHRRIEDANRDLFRQANNFYLAKVKTFITAEPQVRDVCAECNNGILSDLDAYICKLWDKYFYKILERQEDVLFEYDYNLLSRWLLKMCYNSARVHNSDTKHLEKCKDYILGKAPHPPHVIIHLQLAYPSNFEPSELQIAKELGHAWTRHEPRLNRIGHFGYITRTGVGRIIRAVHLQSYLFLIHLFPDKVSHDERVSNLEDFHMKLPYAKRLGNDESPCLMKCEGMDSKESLDSHYRNLGFERIS